jgi:threonine dehydrogenase-like Zn-dependent dehydrogenase
MATGVAAAAGTEIRAAVFAGPGQVEVRRRRRPGLASAGDVLVAVEACGICGTDLHILDDPPGHPATPGVVLGHELVGRVAETGAEAAGITVGDRVAVAPNLPCGSCAACRQGLSGSCANFTTIGIFRDGGLADQVSVPARACHPISRAVPARIAALTEPLSCVLNGVQRARPVPGDVAVIHGAGAIGLLFLAVLSAGGVRCVVSEPVARRREVAERMGAARTVDPARTNPRQVIESIRPEGADLAIDAVGNQMASALEQTRPRGQVLLFGMNSNARAMIAQNEITRREITIYGSYVGDWTFPAAVRLLESGKLALDSLVTHWLPLERTPEALGALRSGQAVKAVLSVAAATEQEGDR